MTSSAWTEAWTAAPPEGFAAGLSMGMLEAKRGDVLRAIHLRFRGIVPSDLSAAVRSMEDLDQLDRWFDAALTAPELDTFRSMASLSDAAARKMV